MSIEVMVFGHLAEFTGRDKIDFNQVKDTDELIEQLQQNYPLLANAAYAIAVNKKVIKENTILNFGATVALLPPFSGG